MIDAPGTRTTGVGATRSRPPSPSWLVWVATAVAVAAGAAVYLRAYNVHRMQPVGWDIFGYIWQTKAVGHAALSSVGTRPGVPVLASILRSTAPLSPTETMVVLPIALAAALGLATAGTVRTTLRLRPWFVPLVVAVVLLWPGTARTLVGYEASLLLLVVLAAAAGLLTQAGGRPDALLLTGTLLLAACLSHLAIFAAFVAVLGLYILLSAAAFVRDRREGTAVLATDAGGAAAALLAAGAAGGALLFGALGFRPGDSFHAASVKFLFRGRTFDEIHRIRPWIAGPAAGVGAAAAWVGSRPDRPARAIVRLGFAWLVVSGAGVLLSVRGYPVPGGRFLLFALPLPVLVGLGLGAAAWLVGGGRPGVRPVVAAVLIVGILAGLARPGYRFIRYQLPQTRADLTDQLAVAGSYVRTVAGTRPVVVVVNQPGSSGAYTPKLRVNVIRTAMPADAVTRTFVFVGLAEDLIAGRPTIIPAVGRWQRAYDLASRSAWAQARPALANGAVVLVLRKYDGAGFDELVARDPTREIAPGVYVLIGPATRVAVPAHEPPLSPGAAGAIGLWWLLVLAAAGWGLTRTALPRERASALDVACLAPAVGAGLAVLVAFVVALVGGDPSGPVGPVSLAAVALLGLWVSRARTPDRGPVAAAPSEGSEPA